MSDDLAQTMEASQLAHEAGRVGGDRGSARGGGEGSRRRVRGGSMGGGGWEVRGGDGRWEVRGEG